MDHVIEQAHEDGYERLGILTGSKLQFLEQDVKVVLDFQNQLMIREDSDKKLLYKFVENEETLNEVLLYSDKISVFLKIFTNQFLYQDSSCIIRYRLLEEEREIVTEIVRDKMEHVFALDVPLVTDICYGNNWYEAK